MPVACVSPFTTGYAPYLSRSFGSINGSFEAPFKAS